MRLVYERERLKAIETIEQELGIKLGTRNRAIQVGTGGDRHELDAGDLHRVISALETLHAVITEPDFVEPNPEGP